MAVKYWTEMPLGDLHGEPDMLRRQDQAPMLYECWDRLNRKWLVDPEGIRDTIDHWIEVWRRRGSRVVITRRVTRRGPAGRTRR